MCSRVDRRRIRRVDRQSVDQSHREPVVGSTPASAAVRTLEDSAPGGSGVDRARARWVDCDRVDDTARRSVTDPRVGRTPPMCQRLKSASRLKAPERTWRRGKETRPWAIIRRLPLGSSHTSASVPTGRESPLTRRRYRTAPPGAAAEAATPLFRDMHRASNRR